MEHKLFIEIDKFDLWAQRFSTIPQDDRGGEWECDYNSWDNIYSQFQDFLKNDDIKKCSQESINRLLYIIARDNESERLVKMLAEHEDALIHLTKHALINGSLDTKWQISTVLENLSNRSLAIELLEMLVNDEEEYVNRRALMELAKLDSPKTEFYCKLFWERSIYGDMEEYQRIAVLHALKKINSSLLNYYLDLAKKDGRKYLVLNADQIALELQNGS